MKWIKCSESLPSKEQVVLIYFDGAYAVSYWYGGDDKPSFKIEGPVTELIWKMTKDFQWARQQLISPKATDDEGPGIVNVFEENYDDIYWMPLPLEPKDDE